MWPYLAIVWCLFVLSLSAPRSWRRIAVDPETVGRPRVVSHVLRDDAVHGVPINGEPTIEEPTIEEPTIVAAERADAAAERASVDAPKVPSQVRLDSTNDRLAMRPISRSRMPIMRLPKVDPQEQNLHTTVVPFDTSMMLWSAPTTLLARLDELALVSETSAHAVKTWAAKTSGTLRRLTANTPTQPDEISSLLNELAKTIEATTPLADGLAQATLHTDLRRAQHALKRRVDVWQIAHQLDQADKAERPSASAHLSRYSAAEPVNMSQLLAHLERYEELGLAADARQIAEHGRSLSWSAQGECQELGRHLERHYRNANLRIALSSELVNRLLPKQKDIEEDVYDNILGAEVEGVSSTSTKLSVRWVADDRHIRFGLEATGLVNSDTTSYAGPATFYSLGSTSFYAHKLFLVSPENGLQSWPAGANADSDSSLMGVDTSFDGVPVIGGLVRRMARSQHRKSLGDALWEVESRVAGTVSQRLDEQAKKQMETLDQKIKDRLIVPLQNLSLEPTPIDMHTTDKRAIARVRLAGSHQLGAHTPRPRAPSDSYLSVQLHQSAINNAVENLELDGQELSLRQLYQTIVARIRGLEDITQVEVPEDMPSSARVKMADEDAIRVRFHDGQAKITLSFDEVRFRRLTVPNVRVHAFYKPQPAGLHAQLVREGAVQLETAQRLKAREEIVLRSMFVKMLSKNRPVELIRGKFADDERIADLQINQFVVDEGWIGLAIGPQRMQAQRSTTTR